MIGRPHTSVVTNRAPIKLNAQQFYNVRLEYATDIGGSMIQLLWSRSAGPLTVIPRSQLYPRVNPAPTISFVNPIEGASFTGSASVTVGVEAKSAFNQIANVEFFANDKSLGSLGHSIYAPVYALTATGMTKRPLHFDRCGDRQRRPDQHVGTRSHFCRCWQWIVLWVDEPGKSEPVFEPARHVQRCHSALAFAYWRIQ